jgi:hypothetical protein
MASNSMTGIGHPGTPEVLWPEKMDVRAHALALRLEQGARALARVATGPTSIIAESEPNDSIGTADSIALGDQAVGVVNPAEGRSQLIVSVAPLREL